TNVLVDAEVPAAMRFVSAGAGGKFQAGHVAWYLGHLEPGEQQTVPLELKAQQGGEFCVRARAIADRGLSDRAEFCTKFQGVSALHPEVLNRIDPVAVGAEAGYLIRIVNQASEPITNLRIKAIVPGAMAFVRAKGADAKVSEKAADGSQVVLLEPKMPLAA